MTVEECRQRAKDIVLLFAAMLEQLDKMDGETSSKTRIDAALRLTEASLRLNPK